MSRILFYADEIVEKYNVIAIIEKFLTKGHQIILISKGDFYNFAINENICKTLCLDLLGQKNNQLMLQELCIGFDFAITFGNELFIENCLSFIKIGRIDKNLKLIPLNYESMHVKDRGIDKFDNLYYDLIFSLININNSIYEFS